MVNKTPDSIKYWDNDDDELDVVVVIFAVWRYC